MSLGLFPQSVRMETSIVAAVSAAPVVSTNPNSPEALLARKAKALELQSQTDSVFDTVIERKEGFYGCGESTAFTTSTLTGLAIAASFILLFQIMKRRRV